MRCNATRFVGFRFPSQVSTNPSARCFATSSSALFKEVKWNVKLSTDPLEKIVQDAPERSAVVFFKPSAAAKKEEGEKKEQKKEESYPTSFTRFMSEIKKNEVRTFFDAFGLPHRTLFVTGLAEEKKITLDGIREAVSSAVDNCIKEKIKNVIYVVPQLQTENFNEAELVDAIAQVSTLSNFAFDKYLKEESKKAAVESFQLFVHPLNQSKPSDELDRSVQSAVAYSTTVANHTNYAKELANERADEANPEFFEREAKKIVEEAKKSGVEVELEVLDEKQIKEKGLMLLHSVGKAAKNPPRLVLIHYKGNPSASDSSPSSPYSSVALVGKGITFDTGGLNMKSTGFIETMYLDKSGASAVLSSMKAIMNLKLKVNVIGVLALAENAVGPDAYKPHEIIYSKKGLSVLIGNTDAEGRLALADALTYVQLTYKPKAVVDIATLTGACVVALGEYSAGLFSNSPALTQQLQEVGNKSFERCWPLPIFEEHKAELKNEEADLCSTGAGRYGGASTAAAFLSHFVEEGVNWAHVDIAGPAMYSKKRFHMPKNGTGFGVRLLVDFVKKQQVV